MENYPVPTQEGISTFTCPGVTRPVSPDHRSSMSRLSVCSNQLVFPLPFMVTQSDLYLASCVRHESQEVQISQVMGVRVAEEEVGRKSVFS